jgi:hypothetical protein
MANADGANDAEKKSIDVHFMKDNGIDDIDLTSNDETKQLLIAMYLIRSVYNKHYALPKDGVDMKTAVNGVFTIDKIPEVIGVDFAKAKEVLENHVGENVILKLGAVICDIYTKTNLVQIRGKLDNEFTLKPFLAYYMRKYKPSNLYHRIEQARKYIQGNIEQDGEEYEQDYGEQYGGNNVEKRTIDQFGDAEGFIKVETPGDDAYNDIICSLVFNTCVHNIICNANVFNPVNLGKYCNLVDMTGLELFNKKSHECLELALSEKAKGSHNETKLNDVTDIVNNLVTTDYEQLNTICSGLIKILSTEKSWTDKIWIFGRNTSSYISQTTGFNSNTVNSFLQDETFDSVYNNARALRDVYLLKKEELDPKPGVVNIQIGDIGLEDLGNPNDGIEELANLQKILEQKKIEDINKIFVETKCGQNELATFKQNYIPQATTVAKNQANQKKQNNQKDSGELQAPYLLLYFYLNFLDYIVLKYRETPDDSHKDAFIYCYKKIISETNTDKDKLKVCLKFMYRVEINDRKENLRIKENEVNIKKIDTFFQNNYIYTIVKDLTLDTTQSNSLKGITPIKRNTVYWQVYTELIDKWITNNQSYAINYTNIDTTTIQKEICKEYRRARDFKFKVGSPY